MDGDSGRGIEMNVGRAFSRDDVDVGRTGTGDCRATTAMSSA